MLFLCQTAAMSGTDAPSLSKLERSPSMEKAAASEVQSSQPLDFTRAEERKLTRKYDFYLLPPLTIMCVLRSSLPVLCIDADAGTCAMHWTRAT